MKGGVYLNNFQLTWRCTHDDRRKVLFYYYNFEAKLRNTVLPEYVYKNKVPGFS